MPMPCAKKNIVLRHMKAISVIGLLLSGVASGQNEKQTTDCGKQGATAGPPGAKADLTFLLGSTEDPQYLKQDLVKKIAAPKLAVYAIVPRGICELKNIF